MALLRGCDFPDTLLYHPDSHLWFAPRAIASTGSA
jgi:glycine cleavage system H protein